jgi:predicted metalloprotease
MAIYKAVHMSRTLDSIVVHLLRYTIDDREDVVVLTLKPDNVFLIEYLSARMRGTWSIIKHDIYFHDSAMINENEYPIISANKMMSCVNWLNRYKKLNHKIVTLIADLVLQDAIFSDD